MMETIADVGVLAIVITSIGAMYYKIGKLETKINFIYENLKTVVSFKSNNK